MFTWCNLKTTPSLDWIVISESLKLTSVFLYQPCGMAEGTKLLVQRWELHRDGASVNACADVEVMAVLRKRPVTHIWVTGAVQSGASSTHSDSFEQRIHNLAYEPGNTTSLSPFFVDVVYAHATFILNPATSLYPPLSWTESEDVDCRSVAALSNRRKLKQKSPRVRLGPTCWTWY